MMIESAKEIIRRRGRREVRHRCCFPVNYIFLEGVLEGEQLSVDGVVDAHRDRRVGRRGAWWVMK